jgi:hypothetical protein
MRKLANPSPQDDIDELDRILGGLMSSTFIVSDNGPSIYQRITPEMIAQAKSALLALIHDREVRASIKELQRIFDNPRWKNKKVGQVRSFEILDYVNERLDQLEAALHTAKDGKGSAGLGSVRPSNLLGQLEASPPTQTKEKTE